MPFVAGSRIATHSTWCVIGKTSASDAGEKSQVRTPFQVSLPPLGGAGASNERHDSTQLSSQDSQNGLTAGETIPPSNHRGFGGPSAYVARDLYRAQAASSLNRNAVPVVKLGTRVPSPSVVVRQEMGNQAERRLAMTGTSMLSCATSSTNGPATDTGGGAIPALTPLSRRKTRMASQAVRLLPSINA